jgi:hypothetical protein
LAKLKTQPKLDVMTIVDFHTHVYPTLAALPKPVIEARRKLRHLFAPLSRMNHEWQTQARSLGETARGWVDEIGAISTLPHLLLESTAQDHAEAMQ